MVQTVAISEQIQTLNQVQAKFGFERAEQAHFFPEWQLELGDLTTADQDRLDQVKRNYLYQRSQGILLEETIKMVVLSPLLELAGFYQAPYTFRAEVPVEIVVPGDSDELLKGRIDALVLQQQLWVVLAEAKKATLAIDLALPQTLAYMAAYPDRPLFAMISNGSEFMFVKLWQQLYQLSNVFSLLPHRNQLYDVLQILRHFGDLITQPTT